MNLLESNRGYNSQIEIIFFLERLMLNRTQHMLSITTHDAVGHMMPYCFYINCCGWTQVNIYILSLPAADTFQLYLLVWKSFWCFRLTCDIVRPSFFFHHFLFFNAVWLYMITNQPCGSLRLLAFCSLYTQLYQLSAFNWDLELTFPFGTMVSMPLTFTGRFML